MSNLKQVLENLTEKEAESRLNPEDADPRVRAGVEAMKRNAQAEVGNLQNLYKAEVMNNVVIIAVSGAGSPTFAALAAKAKCISVDYTLIKTKFATNLRKRNAGEIFNQQAYFQLLDELNHAKIEYDIIRLPQPTISAYTDSILDQPLDEALGRLITKNYNGGLYSAISRREIGAAALNARFGGKSLPVVLYNFEGDVDSNFLPAPVTVLNVTDEVDEKFVKQTLTKVRNLLNGKNGETQETNDTQGEENV